MRVYLDNCCYNRPFDNQSLSAVHLETEAKLLVQAMMYLGSVEYAWSFMLDLESSRNPDPQRKSAIRAWQRRATICVKPSAAIRERAKVIEEKGIKSADAIHLACAESAKCNWFFTVDKGILRKVDRLGEMRVANPVTFILEGIK